MLDYINGLILSYNIVSPEISMHISSAVIAVVLLILSFPVYWISKSIILKIVHSIAKRTVTEWDNLLVESKMFHRFASLVPALFVNGLTVNLIGTELFAGKLIVLIAKLWLLLHGVLFAHSFLDGLNSIYSTLKCSKDLPILSFIQVIKLMLSLAGIVVGIAMLMGKSPALLFSGLGAMTAVLMLVFKDPLLGFVAGIQLSANKMLAVGDWLEMPKYNADGDVIAITLTTVKVRNWDQTITTVPTYALITDSFKNWRGMTEVGGRRIMRNINLNMGSIRFLTDEDIKRLRKAQLISEYIDSKINEIDKYNKEAGIDTSSPVNGRKLTNIGTFRAYVLAYLKKNPMIHKNMTLLVRQLQSTPEGLPIQIYAFTTDTAWVNYEAIQSDIFDHLLAVVPEFGLEVFQSPSGNDFRNLVKSGKSDKNG